MVFQPGQSGNPSGRPKVVESVKRLARQHSDDAIRKLVQLMNHSQFDAVQLAAANSILDRAWGKPAQDPDRGEQISIVIKQLINGRMVDVDAPKTNGHDTDEPLTIEHHPDEGDER